MKEEALVNPWEIQILRSVKQKALREKSIAARIHLNQVIVSEFVTDLMLKGYIERQRRRWMLFSSREYFSITSDGLAALDAAENNIDRIMALLKGEGQKIAKEILMSLPPIVRDSIKISYKMAKFILK